MAGASVKAVGGSASYPAVTTNARGIYAIAKVASATHYTVTATPAGLPATAINVTTGTSSSYNATSGNVWGAVITFPLGAPAQLAFQVQPSTTIVGNTMTPAVMVQVQDAFGNLLTTATNAVTLAIGSNPGGSTLGGTVTVNAVNGVATFSTLTLNQIGTGYTLSATATGLTGMTSGMFNIIPVPPAQMVFQVQPGTTVAGKTITPAVTVQLLDAHGLPALSATNAVTLALATNPGGSTLGGTVTVNAVNGVATFATLTLNKTGSGYTLSASAAGLTGATSAVFTITSGPPAQLAFQTQPGNTFAGKTMIPAVTVQVQDGNGNPVLTATNAITLALATNPGNSTLGGTVTVNAVNGVATFSTLTLNNSGNGYTLSASGPGLTGVISTPFNIITGTAAQLAFLTQPMFHRRRHADDPGGDATGAG